MRDKDYEDNYYEYIKKNEIKTIIYDEYMKREFWTVHEFAALANGTDPTIIQLIKDIEDTETPNMILIDVMETEKKVIDYLSIGCTELLLIDLQELLEHQQLEALASELVAFATDKCYKNEYYMVSVYMTIAREIGMEFNNRFLFRLPLIHFNLYTYGTKAFINDKKD